jgi:hypothetical protein
MFTSPLVGFKSLVKIFSIVDLPEPLGTSSVRRILPLAHSFTLFFFYKK